MKKLREEKKKISMLGNILKVEVGDVLEINILP